MSSNTIKVRLLKSTISIDKDQKSTVLGLGLKKINDIRDLEDTKSVRGMVEKVSHLVEIVSNG